MRGICLGSDKNKSWLESSPKPDHAVTIQIDRMSRHHVLAGKVPREDVSLVGRMLRDGAGPEPLGCRGPEGIKAALARLDLVLSKVADAT